MTRLVHVPEITSGFLEEGHTPGCSCGWRGNLCVSFGDATRAAQEHARQANEVKAAFDTGDAPGDV